VQIHLDVSRPRRSGGVAGGAIVHRHRPLCWPRPLWATHRRCRGRAPVVRAEHSASLRSRARRRRPEPARPPCRRLRPSSGHGRQPPGARSRAASFAAAGVALHVFVGTVFWVWGPANGNTVVMQSVTADWFASQPQGWSSSFVGPAFCRVSNRTFAATGRCSNRAFAAGPAHGGVGRGTAAYGRPGLRRHAASTAALGRRSHHSAAQPPALPPLRRGGPHWH
jgi:hypothetical protein